MKQPALFPAVTQQLVLSASRRTDLVGCYPDYLAEKLRQYPPERVHTVVLVTKNPDNMLRPGPLRAALERYGQLFAHLTITGLGGTEIEPGIPAWEAVQRMVPAVVGLVRGPQRVCWRFDPIVRAATRGAVISNIDMFPEIAGRMAAAGITLCTTSWVQPYRKALRRLEKKEIRLLPYTQEEMDAQAAMMETTAAGLGMRLQYCCAAGRGASSCIDGALLNELHPQGGTCSVRKARGQRKLCGCTESLDLGWYSQKCGHGCLYCYGEPLAG